MLMRTSNTGINLIKKFEGFAAEEYICPAGKPTIGYGHVILPSEYFSKLNEDEATELLKKDLISREDQLNKLIKPELFQNQFDALISLIYNIGISNFKSSTLLKVINSNSFDKVPNEFRRWIYVDKKIFKGLQTRRDAEIKVWLGSI